MWIRILNKLRQLEFLDDTAMKHCPSSGRKLEHHGVHVRDVVLERERGRVDGMVMWIGTDTMLSTEGAPRSSRIGRGTVAGVRVRGDGRRWGVRSR